MNFESYSSSKYFICSSRLPANCRVVGHENGGILVVGQPSIKITVLKTTTDYVTFKIGTEVITCVYLPPSMDDGRVQSVLNDIPKSNIVLGDFNIRLGPMNKDNKIEPAGRVAVVTSYFNEQMLSFVQCKWDDSTQHPRVDHVFCDKTIVEWTFHRTEDLGYSSDHGYMKLSIEIRPERHARTKESTVRVATSRLRLPNKSEELVEAYNERTKGLTHLLQYTKSTLPKLVTELTRGELQELVDSLNDTFTTMIWKVGASVLGTYVVQEAKQRPDKYLEELAQDPSYLAAVKLFKKAQRHHVRQLEPTDVNVAVEEEARKFFADIWSTPDPAPLEPLHRLDDSECGSVVQPSTLLSIIKHYPNNRAGGPDGITVPLVKALRSSNMFGQMVTMFDIFHHLGMTPRIWNTALTCLIPKKGISRHVSDCRPISLTCLIRRFFEACLHRLWKRTKWFRPHFSQAGCRQGFSTLTHACVSDYLSKHRAKITILLDIQKAFDSVRHSDVVRILLKKNVPSRAIQLIQSLFFSQNQTRIIVNGAKTEVIDISRGIFQGSVLSPAIFSIWIDELAEKLGALGSTRKPSSLFFADDIALKAETIEAAKVMLEICERWSIERGIVFNVKKCAILGPMPKDSGDLTLYDSAIPIVESEKYLGIPHTKNGVDLPKHITSTQEKATNILSFLQKVGFGWHEGIKAILFKTYVLSQLEYGLPLVAEYCSMLPASERKTVISSYESILDKGIQFVYGTQKTTARLTALRLMNVLPFETRLQLQRERFCVNLALLDRENPWCTIASQYSSFDPRQSLVHRLSKKSSTLLQLAKKMKIDSVSPLLPADSLNRETRNKLLARYRQELVRQIYAKHKMSLYVRRPFRYRHYNMDHSFRIPAKRPRQLALLWRRNLFSRKQCLVCKNPWTRKCLQQCGYNECLLPYLDAAAYLSYVGAQNSCEEQGAEHYSVVDHMLNIGAINVAAMALEWISAILDLPPVDSGSGPGLVRD